MIPATAIIITRNEVDNIDHCLLPLVGLFNRVLVLDSGSTDGTPASARALGAEVINFKWAGTYPKKRQWCLDNVTGLGDWVFFLDADEVASPQLLREIRLLFARGPKADGYFVRTRAVWMGRRLRFGATGNKLCLFRRDKFKFPVVDDLDIPGMGEIEGLYQPLPTDEDAMMGQLDSPVIVNNRKGRGDWLRRRNRHAAWAVQVAARGAFPPAPVAWHDDLKSVMRVSPLLPFLYGYILKGGFLDGVAGFDYAWTKAHTWA